MSERPIETDPLNRPAHRVRAAERPAGRAFSLQRNWLAVFLVGYGLFVWLPFLAPVLMEAGLEGPGKAVYFLYSFFCHQLPDRSFFLFGPKGMYSLSEIRAVWDAPLNPFLLRRFIGNPEMGWKVAWSDRMVSMYGGIWLAGLLWKPVFSRLPRLSWGWFILLALPMAVDGGSHFISDLAGIGQGFRDSNAWLAALTNNALPASFYAGNALGSFNSWMRLITGVLFGIGAVWFGFPYVEEAFQGGPLRRVQPGAGNQAGS